MKKRGKIHARTQANTRVARALGHTHHSPCGGRDSGFWFGRAIPALVQSREQTPSPSRSG